MRTYLVPLSLLLVSLAIVQATHAGYYSSIDVLEETRFSLDYENVFKPRLGDLSTISLPNPATNPPIRRRYLLLEALGRDGTPKLDTLEQQLNFSTVLIRRGKAVEAVQLLRPLLSKYGDNFLVLTHYATALFLTANPDFEGDAPSTMRDALRLWPKNWNDLKKDQQAFLLSFGWEGEPTYDFKRRNEEYFYRLMVNRLKEKKKKPAEETVDPIFLDAKEKPIRFVNDQGVFQAGGIRNADKEQLPRTAVEAVEQLLIWMPNDDRLLWLLGEVFNASAMDYQDPARKNQAIKSAFFVFDKLTNLEAPAKFGFKEIKIRHDVLREAVETMPIVQFKLPDDIDSDSKMSRLEWWRTLGVVFALGLAIGIFALWQVQEVRRRRQARGQ